MSRFHAVHMGSLGARASFPSNRGMRPLVPWKNNVWPDTYSNTAYQLIVMSGLMTRNPFIVQCEDPYIRIRTRSLFSAFQMIQ